MLFHQDGCYPVNSRLCAGVAIDDVRHFRPRHRSISNRRRTALTSWSPMTDFACALTHALCTWPYAHAPDVHLLMHMILMCIHICALICSHVAPWVHTAKSSPHSSPPQRAEQQQTANTSQRKMMHIVWRTLGLSGSL